MHEKTTTHYSLGDTEVFRLLLVCPIYVFLYYYIFKRFRFTTFSFVPEREGERERQTGRDGMRRYEVLA